MARNTTSQYLAFATAAFGVGAAGSASAALISKAPANYTPLTITADGSPASISFDVGGPGVGTLTISGDSFKAGNSLTIGSNDGNSLIAAEFDTNMASAYDVAPVTFSAVSNNAAKLYKGVSQFTTTPRFGESQFTANGATVIGYYEATLSDTTFTLLDYGLVTNDAAAVPEPASLALLATGAAGIAAMRRRRASAAR